MHNIIITCSIYFPIYVYNKLHMPDYLLCYPAAVAGNIYCRQISWDIWYSGLKVTWVGFQSIFMHGLGYNLYMNLW